MAIRRINYIEPDTNTYKAVEIEYGEKQKKVFDSGNFVRDWYYLMKWLFTEAELKEHVVNASCIDHFIMDGAPYDSAYLMFTDDEPRLEYPKSIWDDCTEEGFEFFVAEGTKPSWLELREICGDPKKDE